VADLLNESSSLVATLGAAKLPTIIAKNCCAAEARLSHSTNQPLKFLQSRTLWQGLTFFLLALTQCFIYPNQGTLSKGREGVVQFTS
jgi:hypothetical protein